jgi:hypothetical protein
MLDKTKQVQGLTVYAEFSKEGFRTEFFMTPDGFTPEGNPVPAKVYRRVLSADKPKKLWSCHHTTTSHRNRRNWRKGFG